MQWVGVGEGRSVVKGGVSVCVCRVNRAEENENKLWLVGKCARTHACVRMFVHVCMCACLLPQVSWSAPSSSTS